MAIAQAAHCIGESALIVCVPSGYQMSTQPKCFALVAPVFEPPTILKEDKI